jgi:hypothetical protein
MGGIGNTCNKLMSYTDPALVDMIDKYHPKQIVVTMGGEAYLKSWNMLTDTVSRIA